MCMDIDKRKVGICTHDYLCKLAAELWPLIGVDWGYYAHLAFYSIKSVAVKLCPDSRTSLVLLYFYHIFIYVSHN